LQKSLKSTVNPPFTGLAQEADHLAGWSGLTG
jgi:hypothetical protein